MKLIKFLLLGVLLTACAGERVVDKYYVLKDTDQETGINEQIETLPYNVVVGNFKISKPYNQSRIAVRTKSNELEYYYYHHWAELPQSSISFYVWEQIKKAEIFKTIEPELFNVQPDYQVNGTVYQIERIDMEDSSAAHINMELELKKISDMSTLVSHKFDRKVSIDESESMNKFVQFISETLDEECDNFVKKIYVNLRNR
jgi:ABC-type uncharacterized transport system auxiliary subunit